VLYLLAGRALFTTAGAAEINEVLIEAGDLLVLDRDGASTAGA
jgi:hypothetical protein